jgi:hypothetical protein
MGRRDINQAVINFGQNCGTYVEFFSEDMRSKTWVFAETGIDITFINRAKDNHATPIFEVLMIEIKTFTDKGGYKGAWPFGFKMGMNHKMVKNHVKGLKDVKYENKNLSKKRSVFTYTGYTNPSAQGRDIRAGISQYDGKSISSMRLRLK